ncbi:MAG TPA: 50S ribosomal protein L17 [Spirochaetota bacterium]|nr:50S ribosomal protein L17 [Spirochaetota bacterium]HOM37941.1 50S ribosomal protein L17 [Spirochaetota bacterium]HPQ48745.1 50S ribosomal protein L17 [Spirochaetota bacterium]
MRHLNKLKKLGRPREDRKALIRNLAKSLIKHEKIITSDAKAKVLRSFIERLITKAKVDNISNRRLVFSRLGSKEAVKKVFEDLALRYKNRNGGYVRIYKLYNRRGDSALMSMIEFVEEKLEG